MKIFLNVCNEYTKMKNPKISYIKKKNIYSKCGKKVWILKSKKMFEEESTEILKVLGLFTNIEE